MIFNFSQNRNNIKKYALVLFLFQFIWMCKLTAQFCHTNVDTSRVNLTKKIASLKTNDINTFKSFETEANHLFSVIDNCVKNNPSYIQKGKLQKLMICLNLCDKAYELKFFPEMLKWIEFAEEIHPSAYAFDKEKLERFVINGKTFVWDDYKKEKKFIESLYYLFKEFKTVYYYEAERNMKKVMEIYHRYIYDYFNRREISPKAAIYYADAIRKATNNCNSYLKYYVEAVEHLSREWSKAQTESEKNYFLKSECDFVMNWLEEIIKTKCDYNFNTLDKDNYELRFRLAKALVKLNKKDYALMIASDLVLQIEKSFQNFYPYGIQSYDDRSDLMWFLTTLANGNVLYEMAVINILKNDIKHMSKEMLTQFLPYVEKHQLKDLKKSIKKELRKNRR